MKAVVPYVFRNGRTLDVDHVNGNLQAIATDIKRSQDRRYTYFTAIFVLDGLNNTDTEQERTIKLLRPTSSYPIDVVGAELSVFATQDIVWSATCTDENSRTVTLTASASDSNTIEGYDSSNVPLQSSSSTLSFVLSAAGTSLLNRGTLTLHCRADRHQQNSATLTTYAPTLFYPGSSTAGATQDAQLNAAEDAVESDEANQSDMRCMVISVNDLAAAQTWRVPGAGGMTGVTMAVTAVGAASRSVDVGDGTNTVSVATTGLSDFKEGTGSLVTKSDDPTDTADDLVVTLTPVGGTISRVFALLWWS
jgi:hypothetical protein